MRCAPSAQMVRPGARTSIETVTPLEGSPLRALSALTPLRNGSELLALPYFCEQRTRPRAGWRTGC